MNFRALLFDLDDTLMPDAAPNDEALLAACRLAQARFGVPADALKRSFERCSRQLWEASSTYAYSQAMGISDSEGLWGRFTGDDPNLRALHGWVPTYRQESWARALEEQGIMKPEGIEELVVGYQEERRSRHRVFPGVEEALRSLKADYRLGMITNGAPDLQHEKIQASGLAHYFEVILVSGDLGIGKPDPRIFQKALDDLNVSPDEALMIGDNPRRDVLGAHRAGMKGVWVSILPGSRSSEILPDGEIESVTDLPGFLGPPHPRPFPGAGMGD